MSQYKWKQLVASQLFSDVNEESFFKFYFIFYSMNKYVKDF